MNSYFQKIKHINNIHRNKMTDKHLEILLKIANTSMEPDTDALGNSVSSQ